MEDWSWFWFWSASGATCLAMFVGYGVERTVKVLIGKPSRMKVLDAHDLGLREKKVAELERDADEAWQQAYRAEPEPTPLDEAELKLLREFDNLCDFVRRRENYRDIITLRQVPEFTGQL